MKSAEEWVKQTVSFRNEWIKLVKQIQLDAMREGMRRAAIISTQTDVQVINDTPQAAISRRILSAANSLTDQDIAVITGTTLAK